MRASVVARAIRPTAPVVRQSQSLTFVTARRKRTTAAASWPLCDALVRTAVGRERHDARGKRVWNTQRSIHSSPPTSTNVEETQSHDVSPADENDTIEIVVTVSGDEASEPLTIPGAVKGGRKLAMVFTCNVCETRSVKQFTERAYTKGVVIVTCPGCRRQHLVADHLGYFDDESFDLKTLVTQQGGLFRTVTAEGITQVTLQDVVGQEKMKELIQAAKDKGAAVS